MLSRNSNQILRLVSELAEEEGIQVCVNNSLKSGALTGATTTLGGIVLGPIGLALGGIVGGLTSYFVYKDEFVSVPHVIMNMDPSKKELLAMRINKLVSEVDLVDIFQLITLIQMNDDVIKGIVIKEIINFLKIEMNMSVK